MAEDKTYQGAARRLQGGDVIEIGSTGTLDLYGQMDVKSAANLDIKSGGVLDVESGGAFKLAGTDYTDELTRAAANTPTPETVINAVSSTEGTTGAQALAQSGVSLLSCTGSTSTSICIFRLPVPAANVRKTLIASVGIDATHDAGVETSSKSVTIGYAAANHRLAFDALDEAVELVGVSATKWVITSNEGGVAASTNFTA
jgi:hypothetical protein